MEAVRGKVTRSGLKEVELLQRDARNFEGIPSGEFNVVVINSVAQYFPSAEYLAEVLRGAIATVRQGGCLFVGDVRSLPLLKAFHSAIELSKARPGTALEDLRRRVADRISDESELVLAPGFFTKFAEPAPRVRHVQIIPNRAVFLNELTRFRYDVLLDTAEQMDQPEVEWTAWSPQMGGPVEFARLLAGKSPRVPAIASLPNSRVAAEG